MHNRSFARLGLLVLPCIVGCAPSMAVVDGLAVARPTLRFSGRPYRITHHSAHPRPRGPSSGLQGEGGRISGQVCGLDVSYHVSHQGDHVQLLGRIAGGAPSWIEVRDEQRGRSIRGTIGQWPVALRLAATGVEGDVGGWRVQLRNVRDALADLVIFPGGARSAVGLTGRGALWDMPAADQGAVLPLMMACLHVTLIQHAERTGLLLGFGDRAAAPPAWVADVLALALPDVSSGLEAAGMARHINFIRRSWSHYAEAMRSRYKNYGPGY
jgi:hypothetical protein